jgi:hypothetical protein
VSSVAANYGGSPVHAWAALLCLEALKAAGFQGSLKRKPSLAGFSESMVGIRWQQAGAGGGATRVEIRDRESADDHLQRPLSRSSLCPTALR